MQQPQGMRPQPRQPAQLELELRPGPGIAVGRIERGDDDPAHGRFDVTALVVVGVAGQAAPGLDRLAASGQDGHPVPALLALPDRAIAGPLDGGEGEAVAGGLQLLQAHHVGTGFLEQVQQGGEAGGDPIEVVGDDPQRLGSSLRIVLERAPGCKVQ